jgi:hypothetical protein
MLRSFCLYGSSCIFGLFLLQCTFFTACFVLDLKRIDAGRNGVLCCSNLGDNYKPSTCSKKDFVNMFFDSIVARGLIDFPAVKVGVVMNAI